MTDEYLALILKELRRSNENQLKMREYLFDIRKRTLETEMLLRAMDAKMKG